MRVASCKLRVPSLQRKSRGVLPYTPTDIFPPPWGGEDKGGGEYDGKVMGWKI